MKVVNCCLLSEDKTSILLATARYRKIYAKLLRLYPILLKQVKADNPLLLETINPNLTKDSIEQWELWYNYVFKTNVNKVLNGINTAFLNMIKAGQIHSAQNLALNFLETCVISSELNYNLAKLYELDENFGKALKYAWRAMELNNE